MQKKIGYNKVIVTLPVVLALALAVLSYIAIQKGLEVTNTTYFLIFGLLLLSIPMYFLPYIVITETEISVNNQFGMPRRRVKIESLDKVRVERGAIVSIVDDVERRLRYNLILVDGKALRRFKDGLAEKEVD